VKTIKYYQVSSLQLFIMAITVGVIAAALVTINMVAKEYLLLPVVITDREGRCTNVVNYRNGDAYACADVEVTLRNFRKRVE